VSLVEQALARLKSQSPGAPRPRTVEYQGPQPAERTETPEDLSKRIVVEMADLRGRGYLPEKERDQHFANHYRVIKRPLIEKALSPEGGGPSRRIIAVVSAVPGDGKTFTSINLALSMALERDISVLLLDSDVPKQHISEIFGLRGRQGLLDALTNESIDPESLIVPTNVRGLSLLPAGTRMEGTAELLSSHRMKQIVNTLCSRNTKRILLLDSPPLLITNEGRAIVKIAGQVVLVVRAGDTPRHAVQTAMDLIGPDQAGGLILNDVKGGSSETYYGYGAYGASPGEA
jgi:exopolysaccharide/PEP-CTERM locus tyrosine autokinase